VAALNTSNYCFAPGQKFGKKLPTKIGKDQKVFFPNHYFQPFEECQVNFFLITLEMVSFSVS
jgi:hypothetical protein